MEATMMGPKLTTEQEQAVSKILKLGRQVQTLGGYAGSGKTTVIKHLKKALPDFAVCAYTGKAAHVLRRKRVKASTIHSLIYRPVEETGGKKPSQSREREFTLAPHLHHAGIIVDEASMVSEQIHEDLLSFGCPLIFVGDHGQLPPVTKGNEAVFNLMEAPDITLETIHRNAGEIAFFAEYVRKGNSPKRWKDTPGYGGEAVTFGSLKTPEDWEGLGDYDQIICAYNNTRVTVNQAIREALGRTSETPVIGDRVICLQNNRVIGVFNGMQGMVEDILGGSQMLFTTEEQRGIRVTYRPEAFNSSQRPLYAKHSLPFDYAWAVTCHKAQGDEWDRVLVIEERCQAWDFTRWAYTAASRARNQLRWVTP